MVLLVFAFYIPPGADRERSSRKTITVYKVENASYVRKGAIKLHFINLSLLEAILMVGRKVSIVRSSDLSYG